jgi:putative multiple sugar transport system ATP-binding protein
MKVADRLTILRDGRTVDTLDTSTAKVSEDRIIKAMVGRELTDRYPPRQASIGETILEVKDWNVFHPLHAERHLIRNVSLTVRKGEVVGIAGLMGAGRTELAMSLFGRAYGQKIAGEVRIHGREADVSTIPKAMAAGLAYVTEDRKVYGLVLIDHIKHNVTLANLNGVAARGVIDEFKELKVANKYRKDLAIRCSSVYQTTVNLSGGNQQKVVLSKWLFAGPDVLILDEPTRGIDVGAKYEIYSIINALAEQGKAVIFISSEMPELLGISDRIYVMNEGRFVAEMKAQEASQEKIMRAIMNSWERAR